MKFTSVKIRHDLVNRHQNKMPTPVQTATEEAKHQLSAHADELDGDNYV